MNEEIYEAEIMDSKDIENEEYVSTDEEIILDEKMSLDDANSIRNFGAKTRERVRELVIELNKSRGDDDAYLYDEKYKKLVDRLFSYKNDIEKQIEEQKTLSEKVLDDTKKSPLNMFGLIPYLKSLVVNESKEDIDIKRITVGELKERKYKDLEQLEQEFKDLKESLEMRLDKLESMSDEALKPVNMLKQLSIYGKKQLKEFENKIQKLENYKPEDNIEEMEKEMLLKRYKGRLVLAADAVAQTTSSYEDYLNNQNNQDVFIGILGTLIMNIDKALRSFVSLYDYVSNGVDIAHAEKLNEELKYFFDGANKYIQEGSEKLLSAFKNSTDMYLNTGISEKTRKIQQGNMSEIRKIGASVSSEKQKALQKQMQAQNARIGAMEQERLALQDTNSENGKTLALKLTSGNNTNKSEE